MDSDILSADILDLRASVEGRQELTRDDNPHNPPGY